MLHLDARLSAILSLIPREGTVADIGCDHGRLACALLQRGQETVYATDISAPSLEKARGLAEKLGFSNRLHCMLGDGIKALNGQSVDTLVIAGMSANTMIGILQEAREETLVLQPMMDVPSLRRYLMENGWYIDAEDLVQEERRFYPVLRAKCGHASYSPDELEFGPVLLQERHALLRPYFQWQIQVLKRASKNRDGQGLLEAENRQKHLERLTEFYCKNL